VTRVLHVLHTWGHPSHTFIRALVQGVPDAQPVVVAREVVGARPDVPTVRSLAWVQRVVPRPVAGKVAVLTTAAVGRLAKVEVVHAHFAHEVRLAAGAARLLGRPLVVSLHGRDLLVEVDGQPEAVAAIRSAAAVVVPSAFLARAALARGVDPARLAIIPSGVDLDEIAFRERSLPVDRPPLVLFIGRFVEKKGVLHAARALVAVSAGRAVRGRFVGGGELQRELEQALQPLGDGVEVVDGADRSVVVRSLAEADLLISPSVTGADGDAETLLVVNLEAQAAGIPVLTTDHGGIRSGLGDGAAVLVPEGDDLALAAALGELLDHPERWPAMGRAGRAHVERHLTSATTGARTALLYDAIVAGRPVPAEVGMAGSPP
jgi:colanic acid/amylovoran biosynthesis glycosyltransferase